LKGGIPIRIEAKLTKEGTEYIIGLPIEAAFFSQVVSRGGEGITESYSSLEDAKQVRDELVKGLNKSLVIYERITRRLK